MVRWSHNQKRSVAKVVVSMEDSWSRQKDHWLSSRVDSDTLLRVISAYLTIHPDDHDTVLWLSSRGARGIDKGGNGTQAVAENLGGFRPRTT